MGYPTTSVLDTFTRGDEDPLTNFSSVFGVFGDVFRLVSNTINADSLINGVATGYWTASTFGPDCEAYVDVSTKPTANGEYISVFARAQEVGAATADLYDVRAEVAAGADVWSINVVTNAAGSRLGDTFTQEYSAGDAIGIRCVGNQIQAWYRTGGSWSMIAEREDGTYSNAGYIGTGVDNTSGYLDNFGGGTMVPIPMFKVGKGLVNHSGLVGGGLVG